MIFCQIQMVLNYQHELNRLQTIPLFSQLLHPHLFANLTSVKEMVEDYRNPLQKLLVSKLHHKTLLFVASTTLFHVKVALCRLQSTH